MSDVLAPHWVDSAEAIAAVARACAAAGRFALDTEADSLHSYFHKVCLIQVTAAGTTWLVDPLAVAVADLAPLWQVVADPAVTVVMHGADYDLRVLDRDFAASVACLLDSQIMAQVLGEAKTGLAALYEQELGLAVDKKLQRADWGLRPLPADYLRYAANDTAHLERLAERLAERVRALGRWPWVEEECARLTEVRFVPPATDPLAFERVKGAQTAMGVARDRLFSLYEWRDERAREADVPPFKILGNQQLLELAATPPEGPEAMASMTGIGPRFVRRWGRQVHAVLEAPRLAPPRRPRTVADHVPGTAERERVKRLSAVRDARATELAVSPGLLCPRALVEAVAAAPARSGAELAAAGLVGWRLVELGPAFLAALEAPA